MKALLALDLSETTDLLVSKALQHAKALSAELWLVHVVEPDPDFVGYEVGPQSVRDSLAHQYHQQHKELQDIADRARDAGLEVTALLVQGPYVETILAQAKKLGVDLIMVGSHGHGAVYNLLVGSVSKGVMESTDCPICIFPVK